MLQWWCLWADHWRVLWQSAFEKIRKWQQPRQGIGKDNELQKKGAYISKNWLTNWQQAFIPSILCLSENLKLDCSHTKDLPKFKQWRHKHDELTYYHLFSSFPLHWAMLCNITLTTITKPAYQAASSSGKINLNTADTIRTGKSEKLEHMS
jgi:hypothetical protein